MPDPDPMTCDPGSRVYDPDPGTVIPDPIYLVTTLLYRKDRYRSEKETHPAPSVTIKRKHVNNQVIPVIWSSVLISVT